MSRNEILEILDQLKDLVKSDLNSEHFDLKNPKRELKETIDCLFEMHKDLEKSLK